MLVSSNWASTLRAEAPILCPTSSPAFEYFPVAKMDPIEVEGNVNINGKNSLELEHKEKILDGSKHEGSPLTTAQTRRFKLNVDLHVLPMLGIIYAISMKALKEGWLSKANLYLGIIDRINIGSAKVLGMQQDLDLGTGQRYSIILVSLKA